MNINEDNYISELKNKNPLVIEFVVHEYGALIRTVMGKYLYNNNEALEECFNDVLLSIWNNPDKFDNKKSNFKSWICAIAKYRAIDALRREIRHNEKYVSIDDDYDLDWLYNFYASENGVEITDDSIGELEKLLRCLSNEDKDLFFRRYVDEQSIDKISKETDMNRDLIYSRISRGKKKIKSHMECYTGGAIK